MQLRISRTKHDLWKFVVFYGDCKLEGTAKNRKRLFVLAYEAIDNLLNNY